MNTKIIIIKSIVLTVLFVLSVSGETVNDTFNNDNVELHPELTDEELYQSLVTETQEYHQEEEKDTTVTNNDEGYAHHIEEGEEISHVNFGLQKSEERNVEQQQQQQNVDLPKKTASQKISSKNNGKLKDTTAKKTIVANKSDILKKAEAMLRKAVSNINDKSNRAKECKKYKVEKPCGYFTSTLESFFKYCQPVRVCVDSFNSL